MCFQSAITARIEQPRGIRIISGRPNGQQPRTVRRPARTEWMCFQSAITSSSIYTADPMKGTACVAPAVMEMIPWIWLGMITNLPNSTFGKWLGMAIQTSSTIFPISFVTISPSTICPNNVLRSWVTIVTKYAPGWE